MRWPWTDERRRDAVAAVAARYPRFLDAWAELGDLGRDDVERYAYYRVGYHRGLDAPARQRMARLGLRALGRADEPGVPAGAVGAGRHGGGHRRARRGRPRRHVPRPARPVTSRAPCDGRGGARAAGRAGGWARTRRSSRSAAWRWSNGSPAALAGAGCAPVVFIGGDPAALARFGRAVPPRSSPGRGSGGRRADGPRAPSATTWWSPRATCRCSTRPRCARSSPRRPHDDVDVAVAATDRPQPALACWAATLPSTRRGAVGRRAAVAPRPGRRRALRDRARRRAGRAQREHPGGPGGGRGCARYIGPVTEIDVDELADAPDRRCPPDRRQGAGRVRVRPRSRRRLHPPGHVARPPRPTRRRRPDVHDLQIGRPQPAGVRVRRDPGQRADGQRRRRHPGLGRLRPGDGRRRPAAVTSATLAGRAGRRRRSLTVVGEMVHR